MALALLALEKGFKEIILPKTSVKEASLIAIQPENQFQQEAPAIIGAESLKEVIDYLEGKIRLRPFLAKADYLNTKQDYLLDFGWIKGQESAKRALEIAAAGGHNLLMQGPPGTGKSLLAQSLPSILPDLSLAESLELTKIYSSAGFLSEEKPFIAVRPFRSPHHTSSEAALLGGGNPPRPGEITLAHRGVLFLDELPEFHRDVLESLRQPIEEGRITIFRARHNLTFPARFTLISTSNPCPCGYYKDPERPCVCSPSQIAKYRRKLSGPLMDRIDIFVDVPQMKFEKLVKSEDEGLSAKIKEKIKKAHFWQKDRFSREEGREKMVFNSEMRLPHLKRYCSVDGKSQNLLKKFVDSGKLSTRGYHRVLKTARTIADLDGAQALSYNHIAEAVMYRIRE